MNFMLRQHARHMTCTRLLCIYIITTVCVRQVLPGMYTRKRACAVSLRLQTESNPMIVDMDHMTCDNLLA
jgi:hypothetical protein